jgi:hypothetical protein
VQLSGCESPIGLRLSGHYRSCRVLTIITLTSLTLRRIHNKRKTCPDLLVKETQKNGGYFSAGRQNSLLRNIPSRPRSEARFIASCHRTLRRDFPQVSGMHRRSAVRTSAICGTHQRASVFPPCLKPRFCPGCHRYLQLSPWPNVRLVAQPIHRKAILLRIDRRKRITHEREAKSRDGSDRGAASVPEIIPVCFDSRFDERQFLGDQRMSFHLVYLFLWTAACLPDRGVNS